MSNYTKTTDFEAKDSLPTGDSGKIIRGAEFETEFDAISTAIATKADTAGPTFTGTLTFETISDGTIGVTAFVDEDDMSSDSATLVPTQQSVKAYVDSQVTAQDLDFQADSGGALSIDLDSESLTFTGGTGIDTSGSGNAVTFAIDSTVATLTGTQTLTNKTLTSPDVNTPDIDGGTIDGATIATSDITVGTGKTLDVSGGTLTLADNQISGDKVEGGTIASTTITSLASTTVDTTNLEVTNIKAKDGTSAGSIADSTGVVTLASSVLTTTDINGGTIDGATIGGTTAAAGSFTTVSATGNITVDGTVDGRDVATDGTKLDGIEALADVTDTTNVTAAGALMDSELTDITAVKALDQGVATTDSPTFAGLTTTANVSFGDNDKAIFGAGSDLQIYHDGNHSYVSDQGTGSLRIQATDLGIETAAGNQNHITGVTGGAVTLFHNGSSKLATTSSGIDVTGTVTADGLTVDGTSSVSANTSSIAKSVYNANTSGTVLKLRSGSVGGTTAVLGIFDGNNNEQARFTASGRLGIGTSSPNSELTVIGNVRAGSNVTPTSTIQNSTVLKSMQIFSTAGQSADRGGAVELGGFYDNGVTTTTVFGAVAGLKEADATGGESGYLSFQTNSSGTISERLRIDSSGNVGIGTSSPTDNLSVGTLGSGSNSIITIGAATTGTSSIYFGDGVGAARFRGYFDYVHSSDHLAIGTAAAERMRIDSSGNLLVGTTTLADVANLAENHLIEGASSNAGAGAVGVYNNTGTANCCALVVLNRDTSTDSSNRFIQFYADVTSSSSTAMGGIVGNGASNVQFASLSDAREKTNIESISGSLDKINALNPVEFDWIASGEHVNAGFVAQEVEQVFPEFVVENIADEGAEERKGLTGGMTGGIVAHLVKAIQEQNEIINDLRARVAQLEGAN
jgi:hypothetical protein